MSRLLIAYASLHGQVERIAQRIADVARQRGHQVTLVDVESPPDDLRVDGYDGVVIGGSIHGGHFSQGLLHFIARHHDTLAVQPTAFFAVGLSVASRREKSHAEERELVSRTLTGQGWSPGLVGHFAGALLYSRYSWPMRLMMRFVASSGGLSTDTSQDHDYTDWGEVARFAASFLAPFDAHAAHPAGESAVTGP